MADSPGTAAVKRRNQLKCSYCRERRVSVCRHPPLSHGMRDAVRNHQMRDVEQTMR